VQVGIDDSVILSAFRNPHQAFELVGAPTHPAPLRDLVESSACSAVASSCQDTASGSTLQHWL
jgi:hypothetical protein